MLSLFKIPALNSKNNINETNKEDIIEKIICQKFFFKSILLSALKLIVYRPKGHQVSVLTLIGAFQVIFLSLY
jgi:hypothetical protein